MLKRVCNMCGKDFDEFDTQEDFSLRRHVGYGSGFDGSHIDLDMCCACFDKLMDTYILPQCAISPISEEG